MEKVAVVTGASAGIGEATVKRLSEQGYTTHVAARRLDRMAHLEKLGATRPPIDLTDDRSIVRPCERIELNKAVRLHMELKPFGIDVVVIEPGAIRTE